MVHCFWRCCCISHIVSGPLSSLSVQEFFGAEQFLQESRDNLKIVKQLQLVTVKQVKQLGKQVYFK